MSRKTNESAAAGSVGAHSVAVRHDRLGAMQSRMSLKDYMLKFNNGLSNRYKFHAVTMEGSIKSITESSKFPYQVDDASSRLKDMETDGTHKERDTATFGIEDDTGSMMKISVPLEQAEEFERHVAQSLADVLDYKKTGRGENKTLADLLYDLKDQFTVISAEFPTIPKDAVYNADEVTEGLPDDELGDEEEELEGDPEDAEGEEEFDPDDEELGDEFEGGDSKEDLLTSVLGMLKSQNEKEIAQANADAEEAKARQAELALKASADNLRDAEGAVAAQAEMEAEKDKEKKAKEMAEIAKFNYKKRLGEGEGFSPLFRQTLLELDPNDTPQSLRRQMAIIDQKYRSDPTDSDDEKSFKNGQRQLARRELRVQMQAARGREDHEGDVEDQEAQDQDNQNDQDPQNNQSRTNDRGQPQ